MMDLASRFAAFRQQRPEKTHAPRHAKSTTTPITTIPTNTVEYR
jgi:hypothetical protein|tara:strand:- start:3963 stop:4094 length:132 start_codon:yes stop_codon:yes gene_type:complete